MALNSQNFGLIRSFNKAKICDDPKSIWVPLRFTAPAAAAGDIVYSDVIDLTPFTQGNPAPVLEGVQTMICYQRGNGAGGVMTNDNFSSELFFENGFRAFAPGGAWSAISILASNSPRINLSIFANQVVAAPLDVIIDYYFCNFPLDELSFNLPTV